MLEARIGFECSNKDCQHKEPLPNAAKNGHGLDAEVEMPAEPEDIAAA